MTASTNWNTFYVTGGGSGIGRHLAGVLLAAGHRVLDLGCGAGLTTVALGVPLKALLELADGIYDATQDSCASFANVVNITAAEPAGATTSTGAASCTSTVK